MPTRWSSLWQSLRGCVLKAIADKMSLCVDGNCLADMRRLCLVNTLTDMRGLCVVGIFICNYYELKDCKQLQATVGRPCIVSNCMAIMGRFLWLAIHCQP